MHPCSRGRRYCSSHPSVQQQNNLRTTSRNCAARGPTVVHALHVCGRTSSMRTHVLDSYRVQNLVHGRVAYHSTAAASTALNIATSFGQSSMLARACNQKKEARGARLLRQQQQRPGRQTQDAPPADTQSATTGGGGGTEAHAHTVRATRARTRTQRNAPPPCRRRNPAGSAG